jgi:UPF0755 protein
MSPSWKKTTISVILCSLVLLLILFFVSYTTLISSLKLPVMANPDTTKSTLVFSKGSTVEDLLTSVSKLQPQMGLFQKQIVQSYLRLSGRSRNLKAGQYNLFTNKNRKVETLAGFLNKVEAGDAIHFSITIPEGWTFAQFRAELAQHTDLVQTTVNMSDTDIMSLLSDSHSNPEGLFLADTYFYNERSTDFDILAKAFDNMQRTITELWQTKPPKSQLNSPYEAIILASIIEKETGIKQERELVSSVFHRRLAKNMRLQTDPTVIYALGDQYNGTIYRKDLKIQSPYNTYVVKGLPPTPIALVGRKSLEAAIHPSQSEFLYFVADGKGGHVFSKTLEEHQKAVAAYRKLKK